MVIRQAAESPPAPAALGASKVATPQGETLPSARAPVCSEISTLPEPSASVQPAKQSDNRLPPSWQGEEMHDAAAIDSVAELELEFSQQDEGDRSEAAEFAGRAVQPLAAIPEEIDGPAAAGQTSTGIASGKTASGVELLDRLPQNQADDAPCNAGVHGASPTAADLLHDSSQAVARSPTASAAEQDPRTGDKRRQTVCSGQPPQPSSPVPTGIEQPGGTKFFF